MKTAVIGAGNGGQAMAGHFALLGHDVCLYNRTMEKTVPFTDSKKIVLKGEINGTGSLGKITHDLKEAVKDAELIMVTVTADAHREIAEKMAPLVEDGQIILLNPGRTLGAMEFSLVMRKLTSKRIYIAETQSLIYACRAESPGKVRVFGVKENILLAAYPSCDTNYVISILNSLYDCFVKADNILVTGLENIGSILHPAILMFNAGGIERNEEFYFYRDLTPTVINFLEKIDSERLKIGKSFGLKLKSLSEWISYVYPETRGDGLLEKMRNNPAYAKILSPSNLKNRYLTEDIPTGILPMVELAKMCDVKVPTLNAVLQITQVLMQTDYTVKGRTLANLGIEGITRDEFLRSL